MSRPRAIVPGGPPLSDVRVDLAILAAWSILPFLVALKLFLWQ